MDGTGPGTSGGPRGTNGNRYFVLLGVVAALLVYAALQLWANVCLLYTSPSPRDA